mmetsp:Transcript_71152/g.126684  ORF Transcript_71152/g.126684 Transcript_71152/m.126684 type:complete len:382 (+) Transcript_71152:84-1229(+)
MSNVDLDGCVDLLGESLTLPEELSALAEDDGFPSRPICVPDELNVELRGALLLPSDSGSSRTGYSSYEDLMTRVIAEGESSKGSSAQGDDQFFSGSQIDLTSMDSPQYCTTAAAAAAAAAAASAASPGPQAASPAPSGSSGPRVGISTADITPSNNSQSSKSNKSRDWSLSDTDLRELLEQGSSLAELGSGSVASPVAVPSVGPMGNLASVPETGITVGGDFSHELVSHTRLQTFEGGTVQSSPSSQSHASAATTSEDTSGSSPLRSVRTRSVQSVPGTSSHSPAQSMSSRTQTTVRSSPPQSVNTGTGSNSLLTNWSSATRSSAAIRNSVQQSNSVTQSGSGTHSTSVTTLVSPVTNVGYHVCDDDILETSINSNFSDLL